MPGFKLNPPDGGMFAHRAARNVFHDPHALDQLFAHHDWVGLPSFGRPKAVQARVEAIEEQSVRSLIATVSAKASKDASASLEASTAELAGGLSDEFGQKLANSLFGIPILSNGKNIVTGERVEIGKVGIGGKVEYEGPGELVAGTSLPLSKGLRYVGLAKRFKFNMINDVEVGVALDHAALLQGKYGLIFTGAEFEKPVKISGWSDAKLKITAGRDKEGGVAFSFGLSGRF